jgi:hypothetical protein
MPAGTSRRQSAFPLTAGEKTHLGVGKASRFNNKVFNINSLSATRRAGRQRNLLAETPPAAEFGSGIQQLSFALCISHMVPI